MQESPEAEVWLYGVLAGDATVHASVADRICNGLAPAGTAFPYVVFSYHAGRDVMGVGPARVLASSLYLVKVVADRESYAAQRSAADRIDALLHGARGATAAGRILSCVREREVSYKELSKGIEYRHLGGLYRLQVQPL